MADILPFDGIVPVPHFRKNMFPWHRDWMTNFDQWITAVEAGREPDVWSRFNILEVHRRARKSTGVINLLIRECLRNKKKPYTYVAPLKTQAKKIVWTDPNMLWNHLPPKDQKPFRWKVNEQEMYITFIDTGCILRIMGGDDIGALKGVDTQGLCLDEFAEQKREVWDEVFEPIIRQDITRWVCFIYTPKPASYAVELFDRAACIAEGYPLPTNGRAEKCLRQWYAARLIADETGIIPKAELEESRATQPHAQFDQEYQCARVTEEEFTLITSAMLSKLPKDVPTPTVGGGIISIDPSLGGDECSMGAYVGKQGKCVAEINLRTEDPDVIVAQAMIMSAETGIHNFILDTIGIGQSVLSPLSKVAKGSVIPFVSSHRSSDPQRFHNKRAEMWYYVREKVRKREVECPKDLEIIRQIPFATRYDPKNGKYLIIPKTKIKEELKCSPDRAERWGMAIFGLQFVEHQCISSRGYDVISKANRKYDGLRTWKHGRTR